jgi:hypothetical protein
MRALWLTAALLAGSYQAAFGLENCNTLNSASDLEKRLQCLQDNNRELERELDTLRNDIEHINTRAVRWNEVVLIRQGATCLATGRAAPFLPCEGQSSYRPMRWELAKVPRGG